MRNRESDHENEWLRLKPPRLWMPLRPIRQSLVLDRNAVLRLDTPPELEGLSRKEIFARVDTLVKEL